MSKMCFCVDIPKVGFGRFEFGDKLNTNAASASFADVSVPDFENYINMLADNGFSVFENRNFGGNHYYALKRNNDAGHGNGKTGRDASGG